MQTRRARAALACLDPGRASAMAGAVAAAGFEAAGAAEDFSGALKLVRRVNVDLLLADAILPGGDGVALAEAILKSGLERYPDVVLIRPAGLRLPGEDRLADCHSAVMDGPVTAEGLERALTRLRRLPERLPVDRAARLEGLLRDLGVPAHPGRDMLVHAVTLVWRDRSRINALRSRVYAEAGRPFGRTAAQAEAAIIHAIDAAWRGGSMEAQEGIFGDTIDARRGRPTCGEMVAHLADILRWEG